MPDPEFVPSTDGVEVAAYDLGGTGPSLVMAHATGFCAAVLEPMAAALAGHFSIVSVDLRPHGRTRVPDPPTISWDAWGDDLLAVIDHLGLTGSYVCGHSGGGAAAVLAGLARPGVWRAAYLYEPVIFPPGFAPPGASGADNPMAAAAARRRSTFTSVDEARARYAAKPPMDVFRTDALDAYLTGGFDHADDGSITLRCRPEWEATCFRMASQHGAFGRLGDLDLPVTVAVGGRWEPGPAMGATAIVERLPAARLLEVGGLGHLGPMEDPDLVAASVVASLLV